MNRELEYILTQALADIENEADEASYIPVGSFICAAESDGPNSMDFENTKESMMEKYTKEFTLQLIDALKETLK